MTAITGSNTNIAVQLGATWNTAAAAGVGDKMEVESFTPNKGVTVLSTNPIGSGSDQRNDSTEGMIAPTANVSAIAGYQSRTEALTALLFGQVNGPFATADAGAKTHSLIYNATRPDLYATIGWNSSSATSLEIPSSQPSRVQLSCANAPDYERVAIDLVGDTIQVGATNTPATLLTTTMANSKRTVCKPTDYFRFNAQGGAALSASDNYSIVSYTIVFDRALEPVHEIRGSTTMANGLPRHSGSPVFNPTLQVTIRYATDNTWFAAQIAGTEYKAEIGIQGDLIGTGVYYGKRYQFPRLKVVAWPDAPISNAGENQVTLNFEVLEASAAPTGFISTKPAVILTNSLTTALLAV